LHARAIKDPLDLAKYMLATAFFTNIHSAVTLFEPMFGDEFVKEAHGKAVQARNKVISKIDALLKRKYGKRPASLGIDTDAPGVHESLVAAHASVTEAQRVWDEAAATYGKVSVTVTFLVLTCVNCQLWLQLPTTAAEIKAIPAECLAAVDSGFQETGSMASIKILLGRRYEQLKMCVFFMRRHYFSLGQRE
jgi:hypothetical protein